MAKVVLGVYAEAVTPSFTERNFRMNARFGFPCPSSRLAAITAIVFGVYSALALGEEVKVKLSGSQEVPAVTTTASGTGTITVGADHGVSGSVTTSGLVGTMAHIHEGPAGKNGPVIIPLTKNGNDGWTVPPGAKLTDAQYQAFKAGDLYLNVHSDQHKGGEIRAQLKP